MPKLIEVDEDQYNRLVKLHFDAKGIDLVALVRSISS